MKITIGETMPVTRRPYEMPLGEYLMKMRGTGQRLSSQRELKWRTSSDERSKQQT